MITSEQLKNEFKNLGIQRGDHVAWGVSYRAIGKVVNGPQGLIEALLDVVGPEGTIMSPTYTSLGMLSLVRRHKVPVFRKGETPSSYGALSESMRTYKTAIRSDHPTNSLAAIGAKAEFLLKGHDYRVPSYSPFEKLAEINGKLLIIGTGYTFLGLGHQAQYKAGLLTLIPPYHGALYVDNYNKIEVFVRKDLGGCVVGISREMIIHLREAGIVNEGQVGGAKAAVVRAKEGLEIMTNVLTRAPENYLCGSSTCLWCREVERRLNLTPKIKDKKWFHKYRLLRLLLDSYNCLRIKDFAFLSLGGCYLEILKKNIFGIAFQLRFRKKEKAAAVAWKPV